jgi:N-succinyldiaminopimelate aminotransferase
MSSRRVSHFGTTVFSEFSRLALQHSAVNLGQGFPDFDGPEVIKRAAIEAILAGTNQYSVGQGAVVLRTAIAHHARRFWGQVVDPMREVVVTSGATEALFDAVHAFIDPGDEVVLFEPFYDAYLAAVQLAGGVPRFVRLRQPDASHTWWWLDHDELEQAFTPRTALVIVNTPHNPTGKVFTREELQHVGELARRSDALIISDEVYEHLVFPPARHLPPATLPRMGDRTLTISSGGKSFSLTGWKVGWAIGPEPLVSAVQKMHQWVTFATASPLQAAIATALELPDAYFEGLVTFYLEKRDLLARALQAARLEPLPCEGGYFLMARTQALRRADEDDVAFCRRLIAEKGVAAIPPSVFYGLEHAAEAHGLARFAFCKEAATLEDATRRLASLGGLTP